MTKLTRKHAQGSGGGSSQINRKGAQKSGEACEQLYWH